MLFSPQKKGVSDHRDATLLEVLVDGGTELLAELVARASGPAGSTVIAGQEPALFVSGGAMSMRHFLRDRQTVEDHGEAGR
jgi:hypothetical protein